VRAPRRRRAAIAVERQTERALARMGQLMAAPPQFVRAEGVRYGGALLALPALLALGILEVGEQTYGVMKKAFYGLRATLLILGFMALLRIRTPGQLQGHPPGELGVLNRSTLYRQRRKLAAAGVLGGRSMASGARAGPLVSRPRSSNEWRSCSVPGGRSVRRRTRSASPKGRFATRSGAARWSPRPRL
jgi:hypothetical protein